MIKGQVGRVFVDKVAGSRGRCMSAAATCREKHSVSWELHTRTPTDRPYSSALSALVSLAKLLPTGISIDDTRHDGIDAKPSLLCPSFSFHWCPARVEFVPSTDEKVVNKPCACKLKSPDDDDECLTFHPTVSRHESRHKPTT
jgi:hypothetical protein